MGNRVDGSADSGSDPDFGVDLGAGSDPDFEPDFDPDFGVDLGAGSGSDRDAERIPLPLTRNVERQREKATELSGFAAFFCVRAARFCRYYYRARFLRLLFFGIENACNRRRDFL